VTRGRFLPTLLEKSRITHRNPEESNFHILRLLAHHLTAEERER
jgi:myosin heavy subunit